MKKNTTLAELYYRNMEVAKFKKTFPTIALMMASRLGEFEKRNSIYLEKLDKGITKLNEDNVCRNEKGEFENEVIDGKDSGNAKFISEEHKANFETGLRELMNSPCQIII